MSLIGRLVRVSELSTGPVLSPAMGKMRGRIGIVHKDASLQLSIFFGKHDVEATKDLTWHHDSVSVYDTFLVSKQDVRWLQTLHTEYDSFIRNHFAIGDLVRVRLNLSDSDKYVGQCVISDRDERYKAIAGSVGKIWIVDKHLVGIDFPNVKDAEGWLIREEWLEKVDPAEKQTLSELKEVETALKNVAEAVERIAKKIKRE